MALYKYFQRSGGEEPWELTRNETDLTAVSPTFVTILSLDTLETLPADKPTKELLTGIKYFGPMYFDLDSDELEESIEGANELVAKLLALGLKDSDLEIYLSGKKGLHILISTECFMERQQPVQFLPAIYKEIAFKLATPTIDFKVYTARTGRLLRTCFNIRENGKYRVPVTVAELKDLTVDQYNTHCSAPRLPVPVSPVFCPNFALIYDAAKQKVMKNSGKKAKPVDAKTIKLHLPIVERVMRGEVMPNAGFNKIAIQLAIYARDSGMTPDQLVTCCQGLIETHAGDGSRYGTPYKRETEIRRMCDYVDSNTSYEYSIGPMKALVARDDGSSAEPVFDEEGNVVHVVRGPDIADAFTCGVTAIGEQYVASKGDAGDVAISNFVFDDVVKLLTIDTEEIVGLKVTMKGIPKPKTLIMLTSQFTGSSGLQNAVGPHGGSFSGSDIHSRGIMQIMLHKATTTKYVLDSEGVNLINVPMCDDERFRDPFVVWADSEGVRVPEWAKVGNIGFDFSGYPTPQGVIQTDLTLAPMLQDYVAESAERRAFAASTIKHLFSCQSPEALGRLLGWMVSTFWRQQFHAAHQKFPLLHVYGPAGLGKTETVTSLLHLFYNKASPKIVTPGSTPFAFLNLLGGSGSIPVLLDEYKPAKMNTELLEKYRAVFRDAYNMKESIRGGGNRVRESFNALNVTTLTGPIIFIAEAPETETAILERSLTVSIRKPSAVRYGKNFSHFMQFVRGKEILSSIGHSLASSVIADDRMETFRYEFDELHDRAVQRFMPQPEDDELLASGDMTQDQYKAKQMVSQRGVYACAVALYGLKKLKQLLQNVFDAEYDTLFKEDFKEMIGSVFKGIGDQAASMVPEYIKLLTTMGDMTQLAPDDRLKLIDGQEYNLSEIGGMPVLVIAPRAAYSKYRIYCRSAGTEHYYMNELSFTQAMKETPQFLKTGKGTYRAKVETLVFSLEELQRAGMSGWAGKPVKLEI